MGIERVSARCSKPDEAPKEEDQGLRTEDGRTAEIHSRLSVGRAASQTTSTMPKLS
jgi:hypothetical protein